METKLFERYGDRESPFERNSKKLKGMFTKWKAREERAIYIQTFSKANWNKLPRCSKQRHRLSTCEECAIHYTNLQQFPGRVFTTENLFTRRLLNQQLKWTVNTQQQGKYSDSFSPYTKSHMAVRSHSHQHNILVLTQRKNSHMSTRNASSEAYNGNVKIILKPNSTT